MTHIIPAAYSAAPWPTRSVRRASGSVQTVLRETGPASPGPGGQHATPTEESVARLASHHHVNPMAFLIASSNA